MFRALANQDYGVGIAVSVTNACPLTCKHCISNSSPSGERPDKTFLDRLQIFLRANDLKTSHITLTGGEPFYDLDLLKKIVLLAEQKRFRVGAITSSFWAKTIDRARSILDNLPGLAEITLSADAHHSRFVPAQFIRNAYAAATERGIKAKVRLCVQQPLTGPDVALRDYVYEFCPPESVEIQQIITYGRASEHVDFFHQQFSEYEYCPAIGPHVYYSGEVIPCCNSIVPLRGEHPLRIGSIDDVESLTQRVLRNDLFVFLKVWGAKELLRMVYADDVKGKNACDLCSKICTDTAAWEKVKAFISSPERRVETFSFALKHYGILEAEELLKDAINDLIKQRHAVLPNTEDEQTLC